MSKVNLHCPICGEGNKYKVKYEASFNLERLDFAARKNTEKMIFRTLKCSGCGLTYSSPIIAKEIIHKLYEDAYFVQEEQLYNMAKDYLDELMKVSGLFSDSPRLLDVGCSNGFFIKHSKESGMFTSVKGVEPGKEAFKNADESVKKHIVNDFLKIGLFEPQSFDIITSFQVFDHVLDPNDFLQKVKHYLSPNGIFFQIHHNINAPYPFLMGKRATTYDVEHIYLWNKKTMNLILKKNGMELIKIKNTFNNYQINHIVRVFPISKVFKSTMQTFVNTLRIGKYNLRVPVENMVCVSRNQ